MNDGKSVDFVQYISIGFSFTNSMFLMGVTTYRALTTCCCVILTVPTNTFGYITSTGTPVSLVSSSARFVLDISKLE
jgi:hypothetical protein